MAIPLVVHLQSASLSRDITAQVRSLRFGTSAPGGFESLTLELSRPLNARGEDLATYGRVTLTDARHAGVVWEGYLADPGRGSDSNGQVWRITATGPSVLFRRVTRPYLVIDSSLEGWARDGEPSATQSDTQVNLDDNPDLNTAAVLMSAGQGTTIPIGGVGQAVYGRLQDSSVLIGSVKCAHVAGVANVLYKARVTLAGGLVDPPDDLVVDAFSLSVTDVEKCAGTDWAGSYDLVLLGWDCLAPFTATAQSWLRFGRIVVRPAIRLADGTPSPPITDFEQVFTHEVIADILGGGRVTGVDGARALITVGTNPITHLVYVDGVTHSQVLDDLLAYEPGIRWLVWESDVVTGLHRFEWMPWPTEDVRYEFDLATCELQAPASTAELWNAVNVRWRDEFGVTRSVRVTADLAVLDDEDVLQETMLDLGDNLVMSLAEATSAGERFLAEHSYPANGGALTCRTQVLDRLTGRVVRPHEVVSGWLCSVRGIDGGLGAVAATDRNGVSVFRMVSTDYASDDDACAVGLDGWPRTLGQQVSDLANKRHRN